MTWGKPHPNEVAAAKAAVASGHGTTRDREIVDKAKSNCNKPDEK